MTENTTEYRGGTGPFFTEGAGREDHGYYYVSNEKDSYIAIKIEYGKKYAILNYPINNKTESEYGNKYNPIKLLLKIKKNGYRYEFYTEPYQNDSSIVRNDGREYYLDISPISKENPVIVSLQNSTFTDEYKSAPAYLLLLTTDNQYLNIKDQIVVEEVISQ